MHGFLRGYPGGCAIAWRGASTSKPCAPSIRAASPSYAETRASKPGSKHARRCAVAARVSANRRRARWIGKYSQTGSTPEFGVLRNSAYSGIRRTPEFGVRPDFVSQGRIQGIDGTPICTPLFVEGGKPLPLATVMPQPAGATRQAVVWPAGGRSDRGSCSFTQQTGATPVGT